MYLKLENDRDDLKLADQSWMSVDLKKNFEELLDDLELPHQKLSVHYKFLELFFPIRLFVSKGLIITGLLWKN